MFIAIEGADGTGKATQTRLLAERARSEGYRVDTLTFPQYGSWSAGFVERFLGGEFGPLDATDPYIASTFYTLDRFAHRDEIYRSIVSHDLVIADRYTVSNLLHRGAEYLTRGDSEGMR